MKSFIIDTNCLISYTTTRNPDQTEKIGKYIKDASDLKCEILIISNVITEFVYTLQSVYKVASSQISKMIADLFDTPGFEYHHGYFPEKILEFWSERVNDYGDAVVAAAANELNMTVLTFDKSFSNQLIKICISCELIKYK